MSEEPILTGLSKLKRELADLKSHLLEIEEFVSRLESTPPAEKSPAPAQPTSPLALADVASLASNAEQARNEEGVLRALLESAGTLCGKALFLVENSLGGYSPWEGRGLEAGRWENLLIGREDPIAAAAESQQILTFNWQEGGIPDSLAPLEGSGAAATVPLIFGNRVPAILYIETGDALDLDSVRLLVEMSRLYLQNRHLDSLIDQQVSPGEFESRWPALESLRPAAQPDEEPVAQAAGEAEAYPVAAESEPEPAAETAVEPEPVSEPEPEAAATEEGIPVAATAGPDEAPQSGTASDTYELDPFSEVRPEELGMSSEEFSRLMGTASTDWKVEGSVGESAAPSAELAEAPPAESVQPPVEPEAGGEAAAPPAPTHEEETLHAEARRFARLLVAEIKLYNEDEVHGGRMAGDIYLRLRSDIDRSREMYEKRVSNVVRASDDYFHSEMIRVLAQDDASLMGPEYPGPQIWSD